MNNRQAAWTTDNAAYITGRIRRNDFSEVVRAIDDSTVATPSGPLADLRDLCLVGATVMDLDADTFAGLEGVNLLPNHTRRHLRACAMPTADVRQEQWRDYLKYGALANMRPLYALMLELVDEYYDRHEITQVLALLHLMSDHLGQLAWQSALPNLHPRTVAAVIGPRRGSNQKQAAWIAARPSNHWARRTDCSVDGAWTTVLRSYSDYSPKPLVDALRSSGTRTSAAIVGCMAPGGLAAPGKSCPNPCSVQAQTDAALDAAGRPPMRPRAALAAAFADSPVVAARHSSPVGHFFTLPSARELDALWLESMLTITSQWQTAAECVPGWPQGWQFGQTGNERLSGLAALVGNVAGLAGPLTKSDVLPSVRTAAIDALERAAAPPV